MARKVKPTGKEIAEKAKKGVLNRQAAFHAKKYNKKFEFTPAKLDHIKKIDDLEEGVFLGEVNSEIVSESSGVKPGKYNLFLTGEENGWQIYVESHGKIVGTADEVKVEIAPSGSRSPDESYVSFDSPIVFSTVLAIAGLVVGIVGLFRWW